jgi:tol-pal system protein YbgF
MQKQQKDLYTDIDRRLQKLEQGSKSNSGVPVSPAPTFANPGGSGTSGTSRSITTTPVPVRPASGLGGQAGDSQASPTAAGTPANVAPQAAPSASSMSEVEQNVARSAYERAFNLLKQRRYKLAITSFKAFLETYPDASYADNAQYWLGEANYADREYKVALSEFEKVISTYPNSPKRADALLKIGYTYAELGNKKKALDTLSTIVSSYPGSTAARLAQKRIKTLSK